MKWLAMRRAIFVSALLQAIWWSLLLTSWVTAGNESISGTEINRTLTLLPGISLLLGLIALYGKLSRSLLVLAGAIALAGSFWSLGSDLSASPRVIDALERATGVVGGAGEVSVGLGPIAFGMAGILVSASLFFAATRSFVKKDSVDSKPTEADDPRFIWDQQSSAD